MLPTPFAIQTILFNNVILCYTRVTDTIICPSLLSLVPRLPTHPTQNKITKPSARGKERRSKSVQDCGGFAYVDEAGHIQVWWISHGDRVYIR